MRIEIALFCSELSRAFKRFGDFKTNTSSCLFCFEIHQFSNVFNARRLGLFHSVKILRIDQKMSQTVNSPGPNRFGMNNPASLEATGPPGGGSPPNDPNMNNLGKF